MSQQVTAKLSRQLNLAAQTVKLDASQTPLHRVLHDVQDNLTLAITERHQVNILANQPAPGVDGRTFYATDTNSFYVDASGAWHIIPADGGSGGVNPGVIGQLAFYAATGNVVSGNAALTVNAGNTLLTSTIPVTLNVGATTVALSIQGTSTLLSGIFSTGGVSVLELDGAQGSNIQLRGPAAQPISLTFGWDNGSAGNGSTAQTAHWRLQEVLGAAGAQAALTIVDAVTGPNNTVLSIAPVTDVSTFSFPVVINTTATTGNPASMLLVTQGTSASTLIASINSSVGSASIRVDSYGANGVYQAYGGAGFVSGFRIGHDSGAGVVTNDWALLETVAAGPAQGTLALSDTVSGATVLSVAPTTDVVSFPAGTVTIGVNTVTSGALKLANGAGGGAFWTLATVATSTWTLTGAASVPAQGDLFTFSNGAGQMASVSDIAVGAVLISGGVGVVPSYSNTPTIGSVANPGTLTILSTTNPCLLVQTQSGTNNAIRSDSWAGQGRVQIYGFTGGVLAIGGDNGAGVTTTQWQISMTGVAGAQGPLSINDTISGALGVISIAVTTDIITFTKAIVLAVVAFSALPGSPVEGTAIGIKDSNTGTFNANITAGGGTNHGIAYYNGTNWVFH